MHRRFLFVLAALVAVLAFAGTAAAARIPGQYIVVVKSGYDGRVVARDHARYAGAEVLYTYGRALNGYAARLTRAGLATVRSTPSLRRCRRGSTAFRATARAPSRATGAGRLAPPLRSSTPGSIAHTPT